MEAVDGGQGGDVCGGRGLETTPQLDSTPLVIPEEQETITHAEHTHAEHTHTEHTHTEHTYTH